MSPQSRGARGWAFESLSYEHAYGHESTDVDVSW